MKLHGFVLASAILASTTGLVFAQNAGAGAGGGAGEGVNMQGNQPVAAPLAPTPGRPSAASPEVRGASQTPSDPATIGTSGRDKQTGATKDKD